MNECDDEMTMKTSNTSNKKESNFLVMKEDMLDSSSDDDANEYKDSEIKYGNLEAVEEAEQESSDDETEDEESSNDEETDMDDDVYGGLLLYKM